MRDLEKPISLPEFTFNMLGVSPTAIRLVADGQRSFFGAENYDQFRTANKKGAVIPEETNQMVDREIYEKVGRMFGIRGGYRAWHKFWDDVLPEAKEVHHSAHKGLYPDQERRATLTTKVALNRRPSEILKTMTMPTRKIGEICKYEQNLILGVSLICARVMSMDSNGDMDSELSRVDEFLETRLFTGKQADPKSHHVFSYHMPGTNELLGMSPIYPDPRFPKNLWVKSLDFPVRFVENMPVLYEPRKKEIQSAVMKILDRSQVTAQKKNNGGIIETEPYTNDTVGFKLVPMQGGRQFRDMLADHVEDVFRKFYDLEDVYDLDKVRDDRRSSDRVTFRRKHILVARLQTPVEIIIESFEDYMAHQYEVGVFDEKLGMHNGPSHDHYKLERDTVVAPYFWPSKLTGLDIKQAKKDASYTYALSLGRKFRISPSPYIIE